MSFDPTQTLRDAGLISGEISPELQEFYAGLSQEETEVLISTRNRLAAVLPEVSAHSAGWTTPEAAGQDYDAAMLCMCGAWSGSGNAN
ncbi:StsA-related sactipeptide RiPP [Actinoplanes sp. NPDC020271]|uniref:StsA-related sactipeptide RiPP n=1 Tax=Actinoplanes sp. NPDC020271 TaxID=3363896 RepID=UPI00378B37B6